MASGWQTTPPLDNAQAGGWALVRSPQGFLADTNGVLFPRDWLKRQELPLIAEHGLGHFDDQPVWLSTRSGRSGRVMPFSPMSAMRRISRSMMALSQ